MTMGLQGATNAKRWIASLVGGKKPERPVRSPDPGPEWIGLKLASTWISGWVAQTTVVDGKDTRRLETAAAYLLDKARQGTITMQELPDGRRFFLRRQVEDFLLSHAVPLKLTKDSLGGYVNRDQLDIPRKPDAPVVVTGTSGDTIAPSPAVPMPALVRRRRA
jgi:hypothetical protein